VSDIQDITEEKSTLTSVPSGQDEDLILTQDDVMTRTSLDTVETIDGNNPPSVIIGQNGDIEFEPGFVIDGKYRILRKVGQGGMGIVYHALQENIGRFCALKVIKNSLLESKGKEKIISRFRNEARLAASIDNQHVINIYDLGEDKKLNIYYIAMEFVDGLSLREILKSVGRLTELEAIVIICEIIEVLITAGAQNIVHRDIKPDNIMLSTSGDVKLTDLGIAKQVGNGGGETGTFHMVGTPAYMPPEQAMDSAKADIRSDIYSLGVTLYHLVTGNLPFKGKTDKETIGKQLNTPVPDPRSIVPTLSGALAALVQKMTAKKPEDRFSSAIDLAEYINRNFDLPPQERWAEIKILLYGRVGGKCHTSNLSTNGEIGSQTTRHHVPGRLFWGILVVLSLAVVAGVAVWLWGVEPKNDPSKNFEQEILLVEAKFQKDELSMEMTDEVLKLDDQLIHAVDALDQKYRDNQKARHYRREKEKFSIMHRRMGVLLDTLMGGIHRQCLNEKALIQQMLIQKKYQDSSNELNAGLNKVSKLSYYFSRLLEHCNTKNVKMSDTMQNIVKEMETEIPSFVKSVKDLQALWLESTTFLKENSETMRSLKQSHQTLRQEWEALNDQLSQQFAAIKEDMEAFEDISNIRGSSMQKVRQMQEQLNHWEQQSKELHLSMANYLNINDGCLKMEKDLQKMDMEVQRLRQDSQPDNCENDFDKAYWVAGKRLLETAQTLQADIERKLQSVGTVKNDQVALVKVITTVEVQQIKLQEMLETRRKLLEETVSDKFPPTPEEIIADQKLYDYLNNLPHEIQKIRNYLSIPHLPVDPDPNPQEGLLIVQTEPDAEVVIATFSGNEIFRQKAPSSGQLTVAALTPGDYKISACKDSCVLKSSEIQISESRNTTCLLLLSPLSPNQDVAQLKERLASIEDGLWLNGKALATWSQAVQKNLEAIPVAVGETRNLLIQETEEYLSCMELFTDKRIEHIQNLLPLLSNPLQVGELLDFFDSCPPTLLALHNKKAKENLADMLNKEFHNILTNLEQLEGRVFNNTIKYDQLQKIQACLTKQIDILNARAFRLSSDLPDKKQATFRRIHGNVENIKAKD